MVNGWREVIDEKCLVVEDTSILGGSGNGLREAKQTLSKW